MLPRDQILRVQPRLRAASFQRAVQLAHLRLVRGGVPQGDDMAEACPEPVEGKTLRGRLSIKDEL